METFTGVTNCSTALLQILKNYCNILNRHKNNPISNTVISKIIVSDDKTRYLVIREGWNDTQRIHSLIFDAEIRNNKIWLHHDGLDHGITEELLAAGIPKEQIVLAFHPPHIRQHTGYGIS
ncbi:MAG: XisI protein [Moorea sp. SIO1F2]|uniref:XisI protein n=1 Tax=Moorena sp. SIO1F2 TaxID=2607819 RepID=UPI0013BAC41A|nr:XisI protein [Moorena sp. SIO1F2]NET81518.1 XisI protein [Moorena sp. SIO1F2]